ncbi:MAG: glycosyltransferase family 1 protein [Lentisphaerales bacterium]|jgi:glycosyltransferase involved in cell wall biosynthesis|nr:MAG: glycosyltransferase family 1 protein [Lentisphaerales bacterium]
MKIILDFRKYDGVVGGVEQGALQIALNATAQDHEVKLVCKEKRFEQVRGLLGDRPGVEVIPVPVVSHAISRENAALDSGFFQELARREGADLIHFFYNWSFPERKSVPCILTVHDVIPFTFREAMGFFRNYFVYKRAIRRACRLNDRIATVSEFSRRDIAEKVGVPIEKISVVPNGLRTPDAPDPVLKAELERKFGLEQGFVLNVGGIHERKNIPRLVAAFAMLARNGQYPGRLIITGSVSGAPYQERMKKICDAAVREAGLTGRVVFTGFIADRELDSLLDMASAFVYPSHYEGFGIPILEAMRAGVPVVTSSVTAMPEVAGDAALLVNPMDTDAIASGISRALNDGPLRERLIRAGKERASSYSWKRNCSEYLDLYGRLINSCRDGGQF